MKRILFYVLLFVQAAVLLLLAVQHMLIDDYGTKIRLLQDRQLQTYHYQEGNSLFIDYEINEIPEEVWGIERELARGERVYVVLQPNESKIHEPIRVTEDKPNADANEVIFPGRYKYKGELEKKHYVEYNIERIDNYEEQYQLSDNKRAIVTVKIAPWGQKAIVGMEEE